jgi:selenide,water dikinase
MRPGDMLILTRALGSGVLFAAEMRGQARAAWIGAALEQMLVSSRAAASCLRSFGASACTDVTGFGLAGHLLEMARASGCGVEILLQQLPLYPGAVELARRGIESSLKPQNVRIRHAISDRHGLAAHDHYPLIFDPQTAGGLLASVAPEVAQDCLQQSGLHAGPDRCACGRIGGAGAHPEPGQDLSPSNPDSSITCAQAASPCGAIRWAPAQPSISEKPCSSSAQMARPSAR